MQSSGAICPPRRNHGRRLMPALACHALPVNDSGCIASGGRTWSADRGDLSFYYSAAHRPAGRIARSSIGLECSPCLDSHLPFWHYQLPRTRSRRGPPAARVVREFSPSAAEVRP